MFPIILGYKLMDASNYIRDGGVLHEMSGARHSYLLRASVELDLLKGSLGYITVACCYS